LPPAPRSELASSRLNRGTIPTFQDKNGPVICWVHPKDMDTQNHKKLSEEEALMIVKAIAKMSRRKTECLELSLLARIVCYPRQIVTISWAIAD
jgi:hypothetical protein